MTSVQSNNIKVEMKEGAERAKAMKGKTKQAFKKGKVSSKAIEKAEARAGSK